MLAVLTMTVAACGTTTKDPPAREAAPEVETGGDVKRGGVWREQWLEPATLDPSFVSDGPGAAVANILFVGLTTFDDNPDLVMRPGVAERWTANADCTEWTFNLRRSSFSNGEPVTAESFIRTMTRAADGRSASRVAGQLAEIRGYEALHGTAASPPTATMFSGLSAPDPQTLRIALSVPNCEFDKKTLHWVFSPLPVAAGGYDNKAFSDAPIGNGPFMLKPGTKWEHDKGLSLVRNESYFGPKPHIDGIEYTVFSPQAPPGTAWRAFQAGELDIGVPPVGQRRAAEAEYGSQGGFLRRFPYTAYYIVANNRRGPMAAVGARKAVSFALDRAAISRAVHEEYSQPAVALVGPTWGSYHQPGLCDACRHDPQAARAEADKGGLSPGTRVRFVVGGGAVATAQAMEGQLERNLGVEVDIQALPFPEVRGRLAAGDYDLSLATFTADYPSVDALLFSVLGKGSLENVSGYESDEFQSLIQRARAQKNEVDRKRLYQEAERIAIARDQAVIPGHVEPFILAFDSKKWAAVDFDFFSFGMRYGQIHLK